MISICVTVKNRTFIPGKKNMPARLAFLQCIESLNVSCRDLGTELLVCDWGSTDIPLTAWLPEKTRMPLTIIRLPATAPFSRGKGLNCAALYARYPILFFIDADMLFTFSVMRDAITAVWAGKAYFPVCWSYTDPEHTKGRWRTNGHGIVALSSDLYYRAGKWDEYTQWGSEDLHFYERVSRLAEIYRPQEKTLIHQWHKQLNSQSRNV